MSMYIIYNKKNKIVNREIEFKKKIEELKKAIKDKLFLEDLNQIRNDFEGVDLEDWD